MNGFLNIDKETGVSSAFVVNRIKRLSGTPSGHMGTLDPLASGILPVGVGKASRLFEYFKEKKKTYNARFTFGVTTDTLDGEGEKKFGGRVPSEEEIKSVLPRLTGKIEQIPPAYSAVSVNGVRSYQSARAGKKLDLPAKQVEVFSFELSAQTSPQEYAFEIVTSGGVYIRALCRDLAALLDTQAYMSGLDRTASGIFTKKTAVKLEALTAENIGNYLIPTETVLPYPVLKEVNPCLFYGVLAKTDAADGLYKIYRGNEFYGIARVDNGYVRAEKKLC